MPAYVLRINGKSHQVTCDPQTPLLSLLRDTLGLTGAKYGCGEGQCGACTVLLNGEAVQSCITPASAVAGGAITTIEGLGTPENLHPVQRAFLDKAAFQCGFCTPGMILGAAALLEKTPNPTPDQVKTALEGHICRCGTYPRIVDAVRMAAQVRRDAR